MAYELEKISVLVVEDTPPMQKLLIDVLRALGVKMVFKADNGEKGIEIFRQEKPDIILSDWLMEPMDGIEMTQKIRRDPIAQHTNVPIILVTGYSSLPRVFEARDAGATEFLVKPFTAEDVAKRIMHVIESPRSFVECKTFVGPDRRRRKNNPAYQGPLRRADDKPEEQSSGWYVSG